MKEKIDNPFTLDKMLDYFRSEMSDSDKPSEWEPEFSHALLFNAVRLGCNASQHKRLYEEIESRNRQAIRESIEKKNEDSYERYQQAREHMGNDYYYFDGKSDAFEECLELLEGK